MTNDDERGDQGPGVKNAENFMTSYVNKYPLFTMRAWPVARSIFDAPSLCERSERADNKLDKPLILTVFFLLECVRIGYHLSDIVRPSFARRSAKQIAIDLKSREGARGVRGITADRDLYVEWKMAVHLTR